MKQLLVGDVHAVPEELAECERLADFIFETVEREKPKHVVFLGDQYNNHASVHVRVQEFWLRFFRRLTRGENHARQWLGERGGGSYLPHVIAIKGNHDIDPTHGVTAHALMAHEDQVTVIDKPQVINGILFLPYTYDAEEFYGWVNGTEPWRQEPPLKDARGVICHQSFNGAMYENGFYSEDGFDLGRVPQPWVISGHIHRGQYVNGVKLWYPGAPRWRSISDANTDRGIFLVDYDHGTFDAPYAITRFDTGPHCRQMFRHTVTPASPEVPPVDSKDLCIVDVHGPADFCREQEMKLRAAGARPRLHIENTTAIFIRESEGIGKSFAKFLDAFAPKFGTDKAVLARLAQERLGV